MRHYLIALSLLVASALLCVPNAYSADNGNGVDIDIDDYAAMYKIHGEWFTAFDPTSASYVYNESGETDVAAGDLDTQFIFTKGNVLVSIPTFGGSSGTITVRIEGRTKDSTVWAEIYTQAYTAATTIAEVFPINSYFDAVRVGVMVASTPSTDSVTIEGDFITQKSYGGN